MREGYEIPFMKTDKSFTDDLPLPQSIIDDSKKTDIGIIIDKKHIEKNSKFRNRILWNYIIRSNAIEGIDFWPYGTHTIGVEDNFDFHYKYHLNSLEYVIENSDRLQLKKM